MLVGYGLLESVPETTVSAQEMAKDEENDTANEIQDLADEADLPLEELMARYGYTANAGSKQEQPPDVEAPINDSKDVLPAVSAGAGDANETQQSTIVDTQMPDVADVNSNGKQSLP